MLIPRSDLFSEQRAARTEHYSGKETPESLEKIRYVCPHIWMTDILDRIVEIVNVSFVFSSTALGSMENNQE